MTAEEREERIDDLADDLFFASKVLMQTPDDGPERDDIIKQIKEMARELNALTAKPRRRKHKKK